MCPITIIHDFSQSCGENMNTSVADVSMCSPGLHLGPRREKSNSDPMAFGRYWPSVFSIEGTSHFLHQRCATQVEAKSRILKMSDVVLFENITVVLVFVGAKTTLSLYRYSTSIFEFSLCTVFLLSIPILIPYKL